MKGDGTDSIRWDKVIVAAKRMKLNPGHLRRLCQQRLVDEGKARWVKNGPSKTHYEVRRDVELETPRRRCPILDVHQRRNPSPVRVAIGGVTITIEGCCTISIQPG